MFVLVIKVLYLVSKYSSYLGPLLDLYNIIQFLVLKVFPLFLFNMDLVILHHLRYLVYMIISSSDNQDIIQGFDYPNLRSGFKE